VNAAAGRVYVDLGKRMQRKRNAAEVATELRGPDGAAGRRRSTSCSTT
jgi:hypothetical protein